MRRFLGISTLLALFISIRTYDCSCFMQDSIDRTLCAGSTDHRHADNNSRSVESMLQEDGYLATSTRRAAMLAVASVGLLDPSSRRAQDL